MKSGKQRRAEIKTARLDRIKKRDHVVNPFKGPIPKWAVPLNKEEIVYKSMFLDIPLFYLDKEFECKDCGAHKIWTAKQQKWWYEIAKGDFESTAVRCRSCRVAIKTKKEEHKQHMAEMRKREPHPHEKFFKSTFKSTK